MNEGQDLSFQQIKTSKYNSGIAQIYRLDFLWKRTHVLATTGNFRGWNTVLDRIWCELAKDLSEKEFQEKEDNFNEIDKRIGNIVDFSNEGFAKPNQGMMEQRLKQYKILMEKDLFLRRIENALGKGTAWESDDDEYMDG